MSRRKHVLLNSIQQEAEPPGENEHIVRAIGSRGSNIIEVEFPDQRRTLCLLPARFHKKLWIKTGSFLIVEEAEEAEGRVTGQITTVLFAEHVKQLKKMGGVWPPEFSEAQPAAAAATDALQELSLEGSRRQGGASTSPAGEGGADAREGGSGNSDGYTSSDDDLPPIEVINNRKVIPYVEDSDSSSDEEG